MTRKKIILQSAAAGAVVGALAVTVGGRVRTAIPALSLDRSLSHSWTFFAAMGGWVAFSLYWEKAARTAAPEKKSESDHSRAVHVALTNAALLLVAAPIRLLGRCWPESLAIAVAGLAIEAAGVWLAIWARRCLGRNWSGRITIKVEHELIRSGPYRVLRHPIYTGLLAMYLGTALVNGGWLAMAGLAMAVFAYWRKIRLEEANLDIAFGAAYEDYRRKTWALAPGLF